MAWSTPHTFAVGEVVTASTMNTYVSNNIAALKPVGSYEYILQAATSVETTINAKYLECNGAEVSRTTYASLDTKMAGLTRSYGSTTTLGAAITTTGQTAVTLVAYPATWPKDGRKFLIQVDSEKMVVTAGYGTTAITVTRAAEATTAATHSNGATVSSPSDRPFGCGDGATTFTLPHFGGRAPFGLTASGHADIVIGFGDQTTLANRRPKHRHTPHTHGTTGRGDAPGNQGTLAQGDLTNVVAQTSGASDGGTGVAADPLDSSSYLVAGIWAICYTD